jgi:hypothetical protein
MMEIQYVVNSLAIGHNNFSINGGLHPNISLYHEIEANMNKLISIGIHFHFATTLSQCCNLYKCTTKD